MKLSNVAIGLFLVHFEIVSGGWVDPDTKNIFKTTQAFTETDDREYKLVRRNGFSDAVFLVLAFTNNHLGFLR